MDTVLHHPLTHGGAPNSNLAPHHKRNDSTGKTSFQHGANVFNNQSLVALCLSIARMGAFCRFGSSLAGFQFSCSFFFCLRDDNQ